MVMIKEVSFFQFSFICTVTYLLKASSLINDIISPDTNTVISAIIEIYNILVLYTVDIGLNLYVRICDTKKRIIQLQTKKTL